MKNVIRTRRHNASAVIFRTRDLSLATFAIVVILGISAFVLSPQTAATQEVDKRLDGGAAVEFATKDATYASSAIDARPNEDDPLLNSPMAQTKLMRGGTREYFGGSVAITGDTTIIGARNYAGMGTAYVVVNGGFSQQITLSDGANGDAFGDQIAVAGDTAIIGAFGDDNRTGAAYVYVRNGGAWTQQQKLTASDGTPNRDFGRAVAIVGNTAMVVGGGSPYVFQRNGSTWTQTQKLTAVDGTTSAFVSSVSMSADTAIMGGVKAYTFVRSGSTWTQQQVLAPSNAGGGTFSVAISGNTAFVGVPETSITQAAQGVVYVFKRTGTVWAQQQVLVAPDAGVSDYFGLSIAVFGEALLIGAPFDNIGANGDQGSAYVFYSCGNDPWTYKQKIVAFDGGNEHPFVPNKDEFGHSVAISDDRLIIGAWAEDANLGQNFEDADFGAAYLMPRSDLPPVQCELELEVNIATDQSDAVPGDELCDVDIAQPGQQCSLRAAIQVANATAGPNAITFNLPNPVFHTITPVEPLPPITEKVSIDATTQTGYVNSPYVLLRGSGQNYGFYLAPGSNGSSISGFSINRFQAAIAIQSSGNRVEENYIGLGPGGFPNGTVAEHLVGVDIRGAAATNNTIGGTGDLRNVISNCTVGVTLIQGATGNKVFGNKIGTSSTGTIAYQNTIGVLISAANNNSVGDATAGNGNLISGNTTSGVHIIEGSSTNTIAGNRIGTNADGTAALANAIGITVDAASGNTLGHLTATASGNLISGNSQFGVALQNNSSNNRVINNGVGTKANGTEVLPNGEVGIFILGGANANPIEKNVIGGHTLTAGSAGIGFAATAGPNNAIKGNFIGVVRNGTGAIPNRFGIANTSDGQIIGAQNEGNIIGHNVKAGIALAVAGSGGPNPIVNGNTVHYNLVGTTGTADIGNTEFGILMEGNVTANTIAKNIASGNGTFGIGLTDGVNGNFVKENYVGTNANGTAAIPNGGGIWIRQARDNEIEANVVSGNSLGILVGTDIHVAASVTRQYQSPFAGRSIDAEYTTGNKIFGNIVGLNAAKTAAIPGSSIGIAVGENARDNMIGSTSGAYNLISGNTATLGIAIFIGTFAANPAEDVLPRQNKFQGNIIGLAGNLQTPIPNKTGFLLLRAVNNLVGGDSRSLGNTIVAATEDGVQITDGSHDNTIENNLVGVVSSSPGRPITSGRGTGGNPTGNGRHGIKIFGIEVVSNKILNNLIGNNGGNGIEVDCPNAPASTEPQTLIAGNNIGVTLNPSGNAVVNLANMLSGILIKNTANVQIGDIGANAGNTIGGNGQHGIKLMGNAPGPVEPIFRTKLSSFSTRVINNAIGAIRTSLGQTLPAGNVMNGLIGERVSGVLVGGDTAAAANQIMANGKLGLIFKSVHPTASQPVAAKVLGNNIGTLLDSLGNLTPNLGNGEGGIEADDSSAIEIGGTEPNDPVNLVGSNGAFGIKAATSKALTIFRNTMIKNQGPGLHLLQTTETTIVGNSIGVTAGAEVADSGNGGPGILVEESPGNTIGGTEPKSYNQIGNHLADAAIHYLNTHPDFGMATGGDIKGNLVGGSGSFGGILQRRINAIGMLFENSSKVNVGATEPSSGNTVVASSGPGIKAIGAFTTALRIINTRIGTVAPHHGTSTDPMGNGSDGVEVLGGAHGNTIGQTAAPMRAPHSELGVNSGNVITANGGNGIRIGPDAGNNNLIADNSIYGNALRGIEVGADGNTPNDPTDADTGPNNLQNYPNIVSFAITGGNLIVNYQVDSAPADSNYGSTGVNVEFFEADASGEGRDFLGSDRYLLSDYNNGVPGTRQKNLGNAAALGFVVGDRLTATATDTAGNSSEFTPAIALDSTPVTISGRVTTPSGLGLRNAVVSLTDSAGVRRTATTSSFGVYSFNNVRSGETYLLSVSSKRYRFASRSQAFNTDLSNVDFVGLE